MPIDPIDVYNPKFTSPENAVVQAIATGKDDARVGVYADSPHNAAVYAQSTNSTAVYAEGKVAAQFTGAVQITGDTQHKGSLGVSGDVEVSGAVQITGDMRHKGNLGVSGDVEVSSNVYVTGDVRLKGGADCAEEFAVRDLVELGTVMVLGEGGSVQKSRKAYDKRVVGIVSGAGGLKPAVILGQRKSDSCTSPIALSGKVFCRVDAKYGPIETGDLLTTSETPGHAMKADDPNKAFGAVIGKAMGPLDNGCGLIPVLVGLL